MQTMNDTERAEAYLTLLWTLLVAAGYAIEIEDGDLKELLKPYPAEEMKMWPISQRVNSPKNDDPVSNSKHWAACSQHWGACSLMLLLAVPLHALWCIKIHRGLVLEQNLGIRYRKAAELLLTATLPSAARNAPLWWLRATPVDGAEERSNMPDWLQRAFESYWWWLGC
jgi:hypothetical protein